MADRFSNPSDNAGNWDTTATWATSDGGSTGASIPVDGDRAIIVAGDTVTNNGNHHVGSVQINSTGVLNGGGGSILYLDDDGNATIFQNDGSVTGTPRLHFTSTTSRNAKFGSGTFGIISVEFSSAATLTMTSALTSSNSLGIGGGATLDTSGSNYAITTTGDATVTGTLTGNASTVTLRSIHIASGGTLTAPTGTFDIGKNMNGEQFASSTTATLFTAQASHGLVIGDIIRINTEDMYVSGVSTNDITVTRGFLGSTAANHANGQDIRKQGQLIVTGTPSGSSGADAFDANGSDRTVTAGSGIITFKGNTNPQIRNDSGENFHHIIINSTGGTPTVEIQRNVTLGGTLTVVEGTFRSYGTARTITVTGDVSVEDGGTLGGGSANTGNHSFGSLTIASGGTYSATSGTTTITGKNGVGYALQNSGTFTHNSGTVQTDHADPSALFGSGGCYNWIVNSATTIHDGNLTVYNNLTINASKLLKPDNNSRVFTVHGLTTIAGTFGLAANTGTHKLNHVDVTGTLQIGTNQTMDLTGLRNISGTVT